MRSQLARIFVVMGLMILVSSLLSQQVYAQQDYKGWKVRFWGGVVCRCLEDDNVTFQDPTFGNVALDMDGNSFGFGADVEYRFGKLMGLDIAAGYSDLSIDFHHSVGAGVQEDDLGILPIWFALNFHLVNGKRWDFYVAPQIAYVIYLNDLQYNVSGVGTFNFATDNEFPAVGFALGADMKLGESWALNFALRFIDLDADENHDLPLDPTFITIGASRTF